MRIKRDVNDEQTDTLNIVVTASGEDVAHLRDKHIVCASFIEYGPSAQLAQLYVSSSASKLPLTGAGTAPDGVSIKNQVINVTKSVGRVIDNAINVTVLPDSNRLVFRAVLYPKPGKADDLEYFDFLRLVMFTGKHAPPFVVRPLSVAIDESRKWVDKTYNYADVPGKLMTNVGSKACRPAVAGGRQISASIPWEYSMIAPPRVTAYNPETGEKGTMWNGSRRFSVPAAAINTGERGTILGNNTIIDPSLYLETTDACGVHAVALASPWL